MSFSIDIPALPSLLTALERYEELAKPIVEQAASAALLSLVPALADYPAAQASSTYRRSGTLGRTWTAARPEWAPIASGFEASLGNATPYGPWVQDSDLQAKMHRGRWKSDVQVVEQHEGEIARYFDAALDDIVRALDQAS